MFSFPFFLSGDLWWFVAALLVSFVALFFFLFSFVRNVSLLAWYYVAGLLVALVFVWGVHWFPSVLHILVAYRSDWSLVYLAESITFFSILTQLVLFMALFFLLGVLQLLLLLFWSLLTLHWYRAKILIQRSLCQSWYVFVFAIMIVLFQVMAVEIFGLMSFSLIWSLFEIMSFLFCLQFFLRLIDTVFLKSPRVFLEYSYSIALLFLLLRFAFDWSKAMLSFGTLNSTDVIRLLFLNHIFSFFFAVLIAGLLFGFFIRSLFVSSFFFQQRNQRYSRMLRFVRFLYIQGNKTYSERMIFSGIVICAFIGYLFLMLALKLWYLLLIPSFFIGYFVLFSSLDHQDDMRVKGELLEIR